MFEKSLFWLVVTFASLPVSARITTRKPVPATVVAVTDRQVTLRLNDSKKELVFERGRNFDGINFITGQTEVYVWPEDEVPDKAQETDSKNQKKTKIN